MVDCNQNSIFILLFSGALLGVRHLQVVMLFFAMTLNFAMRVNMSMAIVAMTDKNDENVGELLFN